MVPASSAGAMGHVSEIGPNAMPLLATVRLTVSVSGMPLGVAPPAVLVAIVQMSCGMGMRMNLPPVCARVGGRPKVPVHENDPLAVLSPIWTASASPVDQLHMRSGASSPRGKTVLSYG